MSFPSFRLWEGLPLQCKIFNSYTMTAPDWTRLENSAIIYPSSKTSKYASVFRMSVLVDAPVDEELLSEALSTVLKRFPSFRYTIRRGFFWWFLQKLENEPVVSRRRDLGPIDIKHNGGYMFRLCAEGRRIDLDVFHALTDGTGALTFLLSIVAEYLKLRNGVSVPYGKWVLDPDSEPLEEEIEDGFDRFSGSKGSLDEEKRAWHIKGTNERHDVLNSFGVSLSAEAVKAKAAELDCTVTELLSAVMLSSLQELHRSARGRRSPHIRVELPVNLRPVFGSKTMRNFASYIYLSIDTSNGCLAFEDILKEVKFQKRLYTQPGRLRRRIAANVKLEDNFGIRCIPLFIKRPIINLINFLKGDNYATYTFSNIGSIDLPSEVASSLRDIHFVLGRTLGRSGSCAALSFDGTLNLNFTRKIVEDDLERIFVRDLRDLGLWAQINVPSAPMRPVKGIETARKAVYSKRGLFPKFLLSI